MKKRTIVTLLAVLLSLSCVNGSPHLPITMDQTTAWLSIAVEVTSIIVTVTLACSRLMPSSQKRRDRGRSAWLNGSLSWSISIGTASSSSTCLISRDKKVPTASRKRNRYPSAYRRQIVALAHSGRSPEALAREFEPSASTIRNWVRQADIDAGRHSNEQN